MVNRPGPFRGPWGSLSRIDLRYRRPALTVMVAVLVLMFVWRLPTGYYITAPGAAHDISRMVTVARGAGAPAATGAQQSGRLLMLTVTSQPANLLWYTYGKLRPDRTDLETQDDFLGAYPDYPTYDAATRKMMDDSRQFAAAAGLRSAGLPVRVDPVGARISLVLPDSPARKVLSNDDIVLALDGRPVTSRAELVAVLDQWEPGRSIRARVRRDQGELDLELPTMQRPDRPGAALGAFVDTEYEFDLPVQVDIVPGAVTGPSAGLMFSLEVYRQVTGEDLTGGRIVAGTGTVDPDGQVGRIGGIVQKVYTAEAAGAEIMLLPVEHIAEASTVKTAMQLVPVATVQEAVDWLRAHGPSARRAPAA